MPPKKTPVKKGPPLVYHSHQLMSLNGVDEMQEKYTYNAAVKMDERLDQMITIDLEKLKERLERIQGNEVVAKATANKLIQAITSLNDNEVLEKIIIKKNSNLPRKFCVYKDFAENAKLAQNFQKCFNEAQKFLAEYWMSSDMLLILSTNIAYAIFRHYNNAEIARMTKPSLAASSSEVNDISFDPELLKPVVNSMVQFCLNLLSTRKTFCQEIFTNFEAERLRLCDSATRVTLHRRRKHLKNSKKYLAERASTSHTDAVELYKLASNLCRSDSQRTLRISSVEIANLQANTVKSREDCEIARKAIDTKFLENKDAIIRNEKFKWFELDKVIRAAALKSPLYVQITSTIHKLRRDKIYWKQACQRRIQRINCSVTNTYVKHGEFRRKMIVKFDGFPERFLEGRTAIENAFKNHDGVIEEVAQRRILASHYTIRFRNQWSEHNDVLELTLNSDTFSDNDGANLKEKIRDKIKRDLDESRYFANHSFTVAFELPERLIPPFPGAQQEAKLIHHNSMMAQAAAAQANSLRKALTNTAEPLKVERRTFDAAPSKLIVVPEDKNAKNERKRSRSPKLRLDKGKKIDRSPYSGDRNRRELSKSRSVRGSDNDSRDKRSRHERESERKSRHSSPDEKYRKRKKGSPESKHHSDRDRREKKKDEKDSKNTSASSSSTKRRKTDSSSKDSNRNKDDSQQSLKPCDMPINISSEFEAESITDDSENESPFTTLNVPKSVLLADFKEFVHPKEMIISVENIPKGLFESLKHILLPETLQRPIYFPPEKENLRKMLEWIAAKKEEIPDEKKKLVERLTLKHYIQYCRREQENILLSHASIDYLDYRVYPAEIVRQIYHNIKNGETAFNELIRARKAEYQMTKAKTSSAVGFSILLNGCTQQINNLYKQEQQELICIADQAKLENAYKYNAESVKYLQELKSHLSDYRSSVGVMENKHHTIKDCIKKWNGVLSDRTRVAGKRTETLAKNKEKILTSIEEKRKRLAELKLQSQKLAEDHIKSTVKAHEATINLAKVKMRYNRLLDNVGKAEGAGSKIDIISEHLFKHYKELLSCPTCKVNPKNCALTKCYHLFCEDCVMKLFKSRNRKCPECNARVGANDYHRVYF